MKNTTLILAILCLFHTTTTHADLQSYQDRAILIASKAETNLTKVQKISTHRCEMIKKYLGFSDSIMGRAIKHSCDKAEVAITLYAGKDLGEHSPEKVAQYFKDELLKHHVKAEIFIRKNHPHGTSMGFYVNGGSRLKKPVDPMRGIELLEALAAETILILPA